MPPHLPAALDLNALSLMRWAVGIARGVRRDVYHEGGYDPRFRPRSEAAEDLEGCAVLALVELMHRFDELRVKPGGDLVGAFKGFADMEIRSRCRRLATTLRNGGTDGKGSSKAVRNLHVGGLPEAADGDCPLAWPERVDDEPEPVACKHEPTVVIVRKPEPERGAL